MRGQFIFILLRNRLQSLMAQCESVMQQIAMQQIVSQLHPSCYEWPGLKETRQIRPSADNSLSAEMIECESALWCMCHFRAVGIVNKGEKSA